MSSSISTAASNLLVFLLPAATPANNAPLQQTTLYFQPGKGAVPVPVHVLEEGPLTEEEQLNDMATLRILQASCLDTRLNPEEYWDKNLEV